MCSLEYDSFLTFACRMMNSLAHRSTKKMGHTVHSMTNAYFITELDITWRTHRQVYATRIAQTDEYRFLFPFHRISCARALFALSGHSMYALLRKSCCEHLVYCFAFMYIVSMHLAQTCNLEGYLL